MNAEEARAERDRIILECASAGLSTKAIAARVGYEEDYVKKLRRQLGAAAGGKTPSMPFGMTARTRLLRIRLGDMVTDLVDRNGMHPIEVAAKVGLTRAQQASCKKRDRPHDWTLSQLERLAEVRGQDLFELLAEATRPRLTGEPI